MAFLKIKDYTDSMECVCFPKVYEKFKDIIEGDGCIAVKGAVSIRNGEKSILVDKVKKLQ